MASSQTAGAPDGGAPPAKTVLLEALERLKPHDHLCSIYDTREEQFAAAIPFIRIGLERGERCIYIADDHNVEPVREALRAEGVDLEAATRSGALSLITKEQAYMKRGRFDPEWMFTFWSEATDAALAAGFSALRATGETEWVQRGGRGLECWMEYESRLTHTLSQIQCIALCQYNRGRCSPVVILDVIRTHPVVICGGTVCRNFYYVPADELLAEDSAAHEAERLLTTIQERERLDAELHRAHDELDRSARTRAAQPLCEFESQHRMLFENADVAIVIIRPDDEMILDANNCACAIYGFSKRELVGTSLKALTVDVPRGEAQIRRLLREGHCFDFETVHRNRQGQQIHMLANASVIDYGGQRAILSANRDVTGLKRAERKLRQLSSRLLRFQDQECRHVARELQDSTAQNLAALAMNLTVIGESAQALDAKARKALADSACLAQQGLNEVRNLSCLLHPPLLDALGLVEALGSYVAGFSERTGIQVDLTSPPKLARFPDELEITLFRIAQESLSNVQRHSGSRSAHISIELAGGQVVLRVQDHGHGFRWKPPGEQIEAAELGVGIIGMRERARELGGSLEIESDSQGTTVIARLPLDAEGL